MARAGGVRSVLLAIYFGSEARAYALGSLLVLWACDRALVGIYARELDYKLNVTQPGARVLYFPPEVALHSWHDDREPPTAVLRTQAAELLAAPRPLLLVLPYGARASTALKEALPPDAFMMGRSAYVELIALPAQP